MHKNKLKKVTALIKQLDELENEFDVFDNTDNVELYWFVIRSHSWLIYAQKGLEAIMAIAPPPPVGQEK